VRRSGGSAQNKRQRTLDITRIQSAFVYNLLYLYTPPPTSPPTKRIENNNQQKHNGNSPRAPHIRLVYHRHNDNETHLITLNGRQPISPLCVFEYTIGRANSNQPPEKLCTSISKCKHPHGHSFTLIESRFSVSAKSSFLT